MTTVVGHFPEGTWDAKYLNPKTPHDIKYYQTCQIGGLFSCGLTHLVVSPLELVKCRMQVCSFATSIRSLYKSDCKKKTTKIVKATRIYQPETGYEASSHY